MVNDDEDSTDQRHKKKSIDIEKLAKTLKAKCAAGGTIKGRAIELQGEHKKKAAQVLEANGYLVEVI